MQPVSQWPTPCRLPGSRTRSPTLGLLPQSKDILLEGMAEEGHLSASASSAHVFLPKNLWWHRGAAFHPQHVFRARRRQHRWGFETTAHNLDLAGTARSSRKAAADKRNESCAIAIQSSVTTGPVQWGGPGSLPAPLLPPCGLIGPWRKSQAGGPYTAPFPGRDQETLLTETLGNTCLGTQKRGYVW